MSSIICPHCGGQVEEPAPVVNSQCEPCPRCGEYGIIQLPSMNKKVCAHCKVEFDWHLKPKQKSVLIQGLVGEENEP